jgi:hypothetical protein
MLQCKTTFGQTWVPLPLQASPSLGNLLHQPLGDQQGHHRCPPAVRPVCLRLACQALDQGQPRRLLQTLSWKRYQRYCWTSPNLLCCSSWETRPDDQILEPSIRRQPQPSTAPLISLRFHRKRAGPVSSGSFSDSSGCLRMPIGTFLLRRHISPNKNLLLCDAQTTFTTSWKI